MRVGIVTQPLLNNYGGILQNYALQTVLQKIGYDAITYDLIHENSLVVYLLSWIKTFLLRFIGIKRPFAKIKKPLLRKEALDDFVQRYIKKTKRLNNVSSKSIKEYQIDSFIVGSDQVWRPRYNYCIKDMFLDFCKKKRGIKRISYAASFGVDFWEYSPKQTKDCTLLAKKFDAVSVREESGVMLCKKYLNVDATWVLDPTLLLKKEKYLEICRDIPDSSEQFLAAYILNMNSSVQLQCESIAKEMGLEIKYFSADSKSTLTIPEWLAMFRDASYVVTDSFHGTVFSIIFEKEFKCINNESRGSARFDSLLQMYNLGKLEEMRRFSINWLKNALDT